MRKQSENQNTGNNNVPYRLEDPSLEAGIRAHQRAVFDLAEINSDPLLAETRSEVNSSFIELDTASHVFERNKDFVRNALRKDTINPDELKEIRIEISETDINELSAEWVKEWHRKKQMKVDTIAAEERRSFIASSLEVTPVNENIAIRRIPYRRLIWTAAAAVIGIIVLIGVLSPSSDPVSIYNRYHEPFPAMTTRSRGNNPVAKSFDNAIENFKTGRYADASAGFSQVVASEPGNSDALFYLGLSQLENSNSDIAVITLEKAISEHTSYLKEARWYLGLAYLKERNIAGAKSNFEILASSKGYYASRSSAILRRLK